MSNQIITNNHTLLDTLYDVEMEQQILGAMLFDTSVYYLVRKYVNEKTFYLVQHQIIFKAIRYLVEMQGACDRVSLMQRLMETGDVAKLGGAMEADVKISTVLAGFYTSYYAEVHAQLLQRLAVRRATLDALNTIRNLALNPDLAVEDMLAKALSELRPLADDLIQEGTHFNDVFERYYESATAIEDARYIPTPLPTLNEATSGGLRRGNVSIFTAPTGGGKTLFASHYAGWAIQQKWTTGNPFKVLIFSLEMKGATELMPRIMSSITGLTINQCERPDGEQQASILSHAVNLINSQCHIIDKSIATVDDVRLACEIHKPDLLIIDYAQKIKAENPKATEYEQYNQIAVGLKGVAKDCECAILLLAQMNTKGQQAKGGGSTLGTIAGSRAWENEASLVVRLLKDGQRVLFSIEKGRFASVQPGMKPSAVLKPLTALYSDDGWAEEAEEDDKLY